MIKKIFILISFVKDLFIARYNINHSGSQQSYFLMRFLYRISNGLLLNFIGKIIKVPSDPQFFKQSFKVLDQINQETVSNLKYELLKLNVSTNEKYNQNKPIKFVEKSNFIAIDYDYYKKFNAVRLNFDNKDLLSNKTISKFIIESNFSEKIDKIVGVKTSLIAADCWITLPVPEVKENYELMTKYQDTQMWHRDVDHLRDLKVFIYLNDVLDDKDGPFEIIQGTNCHDKFDQKNYIDKIKFRISNNYTKRYYQNKIKSIYGKEGTAFLADTRAFHRGNVIIGQKYRIVLMLYYSTHLFGKEKKISLEKNFESYSLWKNQVEQNKYLSLFNG